MLCCASLASFALLVVACSGRAISFDDQERVSILPSDASADDASEQLPLDFDADSAARPDVGILDDGRCETVTLRAPTSDSGPPTYDRVLVSGDSARFERTAENVVTVTCSAADEVLLRVTFGPVVGNGPHVTPVGALELAGMPSDRRCQVDNVVDGPLSISGVITCDREPYADSNVFARGEPGGLASFVATRR